jgi:ABC-type bacteriocin/lantibiotic exporter with double-glycine peptidase domain
MSKMKNNINNLLRFGIVMIFSQIVMLIFLVYLTFSSGNLSFTGICIVIVVVCLGVNIACYLKAKKMKKILDFINKSKIEYGKN